MRELQSLLSAERRETHISWVLLAGATAYKLKEHPSSSRLWTTARSSVDTALCHEGLRLNPRRAPDVYRGVRAVVPAADGGLRFAEEYRPQAVAYAVEMRRYDEDATLL